MYDKVFEQAESFFKPVTEILALNAETFDTLRTKNADLVNEVLNDSIEYAKGLSQPNMDVDAFISAQQSYFDGLRDKLTNNAQNNYELIADMQGKLGELLQGAWTEASAETAAAVTAAKPKPRKKAPAKKAAAKAEPKVEAPKTEEPAAQG